MATLRQIIDNTPELAALAAAGDYPGIAAWLSERPLVENPEPQRDVPRPPTLKEVYAAISTSEAAAIYGTPGLAADIRAALDGGDPEYLQMMLDIVTELGILSATSIQQVSALLARTQPDPSWQPQIPSEPRWATLGLSRAPQPADVQLVLNSEG